MIRDEFTACENLTTPFNVMSSSATVCSIWPIHPELMHAVMAAGKMAAPIDFAADLCIPYTVIEQRSDRLVMDGCAQLCKCFLILFNILFALVGFGLVSLGMWLRFGAETRGFFDIDLKTAQFTIGVAVLVGTGALMLLVAIIGDCGACNHSKSALGVFSGLLSFLIIIEISAGVMAFMWSGKVAEELANFYITIYTQYVNAQSPGQAMSLKLFHNAFECCGIGGPIELLVRDTCPEGSFLKQLSFPSCPHEIQNMFNSNAPMVLGGFLGTAGIMMLALVCSVVYSRHISQSRATPSTYVLLTNQPSVLYPHAHVPHAPQQI